MPHLSADLMLISYSKLLGVNQKESNDRLNKAKLTNSNTILSHETAHRSVKDGISDVENNIEAGNSILLKVSQSLKFE